MEFLFLIIISVIALCIMTIIFEINFKKMKKVGMDESLNKLAKKYADNLQICKSILKKIGNETVSIEENINSDTTMYIALTNKITIGDTKNSFTRIQTMAHECIHSIQPRRMLMFNFLYSNFYIFYFIIVIIMLVIKRLNNELLFLNVFLILSLIYYAIRIYLENEAMFKAKYLAKEYMQEQNISTNQEIEQIVNGFENVNKLGIKSVNYSFLLQILLKVIIFSIVALIF